MKISILWTNAFAILWIIDSQPFGYAFLTENLHINMNSLKKFLIVSKKSKCSFMKSIISSISKVLPYFEILVILP